MLEVDQLTRQYGSFKAVDKVSFTINNGEIVGLLGHNGAGKTTIMKMISGFLEPNNGSIKVDSNNLEGDAKTIQLGLGYLPESLPVYPEMTVVDYLDYTADLKGLIGEYKTAEIKRVIAATDISEKLLSTISTLSRGYKQRVGVAQAILGKPKLLILDEPTNGLDPEQTQHMRQLIRDIAKDATVILSTHIMQEVDALCSRVLMLRMGQLVVDAELDTLRHTNHLLLETTLGAEQLSSLKEIEGIEEVHSLGTINGESSEPSKYRIQLAEGVVQEERAIRAKLAKAVVDTGGELFLLQPEYRDLETLFREVNEENLSSEELNNAA